MGLIGGALGALFINVNTRVNAFRKKILTKPWMKPLETALFCFVTTSVWFWLPYYNQSCVAPKDT
jgi:H+/Cl- antiporter ClcA